MDSSPFHVLGILGTAKDKQKKNSEFLKSDLVIANKRKSAFQADV